MFFRKWLRKRAAIVGETTGGGAYPGGTRPIDQRFVAFVPIGRAINPVTNTNWEGTGVEPHVKVKKDKALVTAHTLAMEKLAEKATAEADQLYYQWYAAYLKTKSDPVVLTSDQMEACTGSFGIRHVLKEDGRLFYQREERPKMALTPLNTKTFALEDDPAILFTIEMQGGRAIALVLESVDGWRERNERSQSQP